MVTGWFLANPWSQPGIDRTGTKAALTNVRGNSQTRPKEPTDSSSLMAKPTYALTVQMTTPNTTPSTTMATAGRKPLWNRNPTA